MTAKTTKSRKKAAPPTVTAETDHPKAARAWRMYLIAGAGSALLALMMVLAAVYLLRNHAQKPEATLHNLWHAISTQDAARAEKLMDKHAVARSVVRQLVAMDAASRPQGGPYTLQVLDLLAPDLELALVLQIDTLLKTGGFATPTGGVQTLWHRLWTEATQQGAPEMLVSRQRETTATITLRLPVADANEPLSVVLGLTRDGELWRLTAIENLRPLIDGIHRARLQRAERLNAPLREEIRQHLTFSGLELLPPSDEMDGTYNLRAVVTNTGERTVSAFSARLSLVREDGGLLQSVDIRHEGTPLITGNAVDKVWPLGLRTLTTTAGSVTLLMEPSHLTFENGSTLKLVTPNDL
jgi:hypothetical protein